MTNVDRRIEALESEVRELRAQLAQTKAPVLPKAKTVDPNAGEVGVYTTAPINRSFVMPNETQLAELLDIA
ncbi:MAG: hypothetical protein ACXWCY_31690, partial [Burkholderiales bacterium]